MRGRALRRAAIVAACVVITGCGGGNGGSGDYYKRMAALGEGFATDLGALTTRLSAATDPASAATALKAADGLLRRTEASVKELDPPDRDAAAQKRLLAQFDGAEAAAAAASKAAADQNMTEVFSAIGRFSDAATAIPTTFLDITVHAPDRAP